MTDEYDPIDDASEPATTDHPLLLTDGGEDSTVDGVLTGIRPVGEASLEVTDEERVAGR